MPKRHRHRQPSRHSTAVVELLAAAAPQPRADPKPEDVATLLLDPSRVRPVIVISRFPEEEHPRLDAEEIMRELKGLADVVVITNGQATYRLEELLPVDTHVFGSAVRVYPPELKWTEDPYSSPLRLVRSTADIGPVTAKIISDVEALAFSGGWKTATPVSQRNIKEESGLIKGIAPDGSRAVLELENGRQVFLPAESTGLGVPLHWILRDGMTILGTFDTAKSIFSIAPIEPTAPGEGYADGDLMPALVLSVEAGSASLALVPGHSHIVRLNSVSSNELDSLADLLTEGEVVAVRLHRNNGRISLSMLDVDDSDPVLRAPELLPGGGPWLVPGRDLVEKAPQFSKPRPDAPIQTAQNQSQGERVTALKTAELTLAAERAKRKELEREVATLKSANREHQVHAAEAEADVMLGRQQTAELVALQQEADRLRRDLAAASKHLSDLRKKLRGVRKEEAVPDRVLQDDEENFRFLLNLTWAIQIPPADKDRLVLGPFRIGRNFLSSLSEQPKEKQKKALKAIVDLLVNDLTKLSAREAHPYRTNASGGSAVMTRNDNQDVCWRLSIEQNVAAARRLHYWKCADGVIELSSVTVHDGTQA
jgi:hypothetical protein